jgi:DNA polymerase II large subunit
VEPPPGTCSHSAPVAEGRCTACGDCLHDIVLNGVCYHCGASDIQVTVKPIADAPVIPATRLRRR